MPVFLPPVTQEMTHDKSPSFPFRFNPIICRRVEFDETSGRATTTTRFVDDVSLLYHPSTVYNVPRNLFRPIERGAPTWFYKDAKKQLVEALQAPFAALDPSPSCPWPGGVHINSTSIRDSKISLDEFNAAFDTKWSAKLLKILAAERKY